MVTLMTLGAYCTVRALTGGRGGRWLALAGVALGFAFLAKMLEGLMVLPALGLVYLIAAPVNIRRRLLHLVGAAAALIVSAGWYVVLTMLWPSGTRPYMAGSTNNSFMNLVLGYNGFGRVLGSNHHGGQQASLPQQCLMIASQRFSGHGGRGGGHGGWGGGQTGLARLFTGEFGLEVSFLLPAAIVALIAVLVLRGRAPRTDLVRAGVILFGAWTVVDGLLLAEMKQAGHPYYSLSMVPGIVGVVALGLTEAWRHRGGRAGRIALAAQLAAAGGWGFALLSTNTAYVPVLRWIVLAATIVAVALALVPPTRLPRGVTVVGLVFAAVAVFGGSAAYVGSAVGHDQRGGNPTVTVNEGGSGHGGFGGWGNTQANTALDSLLTGTNTKWSAAINGSSQAAGLELNTGTSVIAVGGFTGQDPSPTLAQFQSYVRNHQIGYYVVSAGGPGGGRGGFATTDGAAPSATELQCQLLSRGNATTNQVIEWVQKYFTPTTVGGQTVYNLTNPPAAAFSAQ
jgi:4-amino-4-deoxy-L-arabinose transferase-like glycosyltransferase